MYNESQVLNSIILYFSLDQCLRELETKHHINRWLPSDEEYISYKTCLANEQKEQQIQALFSGSQRRAYLLQMKAKYAGNVHYLYKVCPILFALIH